MTYMNYYSEHDPKAAAWLRELIRAGEIPPGDVDERDIQNVKPNELKGYIQHHFFAGIGGWSYALKLAGWPETRPVWTGSCPCQPFSVSGKGLCESDERHLWPDFRNLIGQCRPGTVFGEQVASADGREWIAGVSSNLEALAYRFGAANLCAAGVGSPQKRQRLFWVAESNPVAVNKSERWSGVESERPEGFEQRTRIGGGGSNRKMAIADGEQNKPTDAGRLHAESCGSGANGTLANAKSKRESAERGCPREGIPQPDGSCRMVQPDGPGRDAGRIAAAPTGHRDSVEPAGFWSEHRLHPTSDGKARRVPVEPVFQRMVDGISDSLDALRTAGLCEEQIQKLIQAAGGFPLSDSVPSRVALLKGYGNAIVPELAAEFIKSYVDTLND